MSAETVGGNLPRQEFKSIVAAVEDALKEGDAGAALQGAGLGGALTDAVTNAVDDALSISLFDALLHGWSGVTSLRKLTGAKGPMDGKPRTAALAKHKLAVTYKPELHITLGKLIDLKKIKLPTSVQFALEGVSLTVVDRVVTKAAAGTVTPMLVVKVEDTKVVETKLPPYEISRDLVDPA